MLPVFVIQLLKLQLLLFSYKIEEIPTMKEKWQDFALLHVLLDNNTYRGNRLLDRIRQ